MNSKVINRGILLFLFILGLGTLNSTFSQKEAFGTITILEYGFPEYQESYKVRDSINKKWKIEYVRVADCIVSEEIVDSVINYNKTSYYKLEKKFGKDWKERYEADIDEALRLEEIRQESLFCISISVENDQLVENVKSNGINRWIFSYQHKDSTKQFKTNQQNNFIEIKNLNDSKTDILYRGINNLFEYNVADLNDTYTFKCNCSISKSRLGDSSLLTPFQFYVNPHANKDCKLTIINTQEDSVTFNFKTSIFPIPTILLDEVVAGDTLQRSLISSTINISLAMPEDFTYGLGKREIIGWEVKCGDSLLSYGKGSLIDFETTKKIMLLAEGSVLEIYCKIRGVDDSIRLRKGRFLIK